MKLFFVKLFLLISSICFSQVYLPTTTNFKKALKQGTRTISGIPGEKYWQNKADYVINAEVFPTTKTLIGSEVISYQNNSPSDLNKIVLHIFQNMYKKGAQRDDPVHIDDVTIGVNLSNIKINANATQDYKVEATQLIISLKAPLKTNQKIEISLDWQFIIPTKSDIRMGGKDANSFFLGQWFPKVAVYDDIKGWDRNIHTNGQEFYYDLGNYKYNIKVPEGFLVWGTGTNTSAKKNLSKKIYKKYIKAQNSETFQNIITASDYDSGKKLTKNTLWQYEANDVSDVAFAISNHFLWDGTSLTLSNGNKIFVDAVYPKTTTDFAEVAELAKKSIHYLSTETPGYPFPFPAMTIFNL